MNTFPGLTDAQIDAILHYVETYAQPLGATNTSNYPNATQEDHTVLYGIVTFILALFVFGLHLVNNNLKRLADEKKGLPEPYRVPWYRNKYYIATASIVLMILLGWWLTEAGHRPGPSARLSTAAAHLLFSPRTRRSEPDQLPALSRQRLVR